MTVLIIDNEINIRTGLKHMITVFCPFVVNCIEANGVQSGIKRIEEENPDIVFLDVELDDGTGMDLLSQLEDISFALIFITAHDKYAVDAFKFSAIDFLLKPIDSDDLIKALDKAKNQQKNKLFNQQLKVMQESLNKITSKEKRIVLKDSNSIYFINVIDIVRCESSGQYTEFYIEGMKKLVISRSLKEYEELLTYYGFIRPHHSHLINTSKILRFDKVNGGVLIMENLDEIPVSHRKKPQILNVLDNL